MKKYALYNSLACNGRGKELAMELKALYPDDERIFQDVIELQDYAAYVKETDAPIVICGGDGTINKFANQTKGVRDGKEIYYFACGSGNDFMRDVAEEGEKIVRIDEYLKGLPTVIVKGTEYEFVNGVGYGIDGYCCEVGDKIRAQKPGAKIDYTGIAIKGLLFHYQTTGATVTVDGETHTFDKVWLAPTMHGRYYGGGMLPCPDQNRKDDKVSLMLFYGSGKLKTLMIFPNIFKGKHVKHDKHIKIFTGKEITVKFDEPRALQIDGETILDVAEYTVRI